MPSSVSESTRGGKPANPHIFSPLPSLILTPLGQRWRPCSPRLARTGIETSCSIARTIDHIDSICTHFGLCKQDFGLQRWRSASCEISKWTLAFVIVPISQNSNQQPTTRYHIGVGTEFDRACTMSLVKEVTERSGSSSTAPPSAPTPSQTGFPKVQHRSQRISQFKRARGAATTGPSARSYANRPPVVQSSSETPFSTRNEPDLSEREAVGKSTQDLLKDVQGENDTKIAGMSRSERDHELEELESMISPDLLAMLRSRAEKKVAVASSSKDQPPMEEAAHIEDGPNTSAQPVEQLEVGSDQTEAAKVPIAQSIPESRGTYSGNPAKSYMN